MCPPLLSCAQIRLRSLWYIFATGSSCVLRHSSDGKDTAMKKKGLKNRRKRRFDPNHNRRCFLSDDGKYYCYWVWDEESHTDVLVQYEVGKGEYTEEMTIFLADEDDEFEIGQDRYEDIQDGSFNDSVARYEKGENAEDDVSPWDKILDDKDCFGEDEEVDEEEENPDLAKIRKVIEEECTEEQKTLFYKHFGEGCQLEEIRKEEIARTGKEIGKSALTNRKNRLIEKVAKSAFGIEPVKKKKKKDAAADDGSES